jgi:hypothetical protein
MSNRGGLFILIIGVVGAFFAVQAVLSGEVRIVWSRLGGWGSMATTVSRDEQPVTFWAATSFYGLGGLALAGLGVYRLLVHAP